jgi:transposase
VIVRTIKLKLTKKQESTLDSWLWSLTGVFNWAIKKIEHDAKDGIYYSSLEFHNLTANHSKKMEIPSHVMQGVLKLAHDAWGRCFKKIAKKPKLKGQRNKLNSIPFPDPFKVPVENRISVLGLGSVNYHKQELPDAKIKCGRILKKASGWYLALWFDATYKFPVKDTDKAIGIDPGFSTLLTLSDGTKIENPRELRKGAERLAQAQRGKRQQLVARIQERQANKRGDRNHKISRWLVENYSTICYSDDNFKGIAKKFGKSVSEASLGSLLGFMTYKGSNCGRKIVPVSSVDTTKTCSACGALTGPTGLAGLSVRSWGCSVCGTVHDRDINSAMVVLNSGLGISLKSLATEKLTGIPRL